MEYLPVMYKALGSNSSNAKKKKKKPKNFHFTERKPWLLCGTSELPAPYSCALGPLLSKLRFS
jgi:hypothetical protein